MNHFKTRHEQEDGKNQRSLYLLSRLLVLNFLTIAFSPLLYYIYVFALHLLSISFRSSLDHFLLLLSTFFAISSSSRQSALCFFFLLLDHWILLEILLFISVPVQINQKRNHFRFDLLNISRNDEIVVAVGRWNILITLFDQTEILVWKIVSVEMKSKISMYLKILWKFSIFFLHKK